MIDSHQLSGVRAGAIYVIGKCGSDNGAILLCLCDCGKKFKRKAGSVKRGLRDKKEQSCGCSKEAREIALTGGRTCPKCTTHKPASDFSTSKTTNHGLQIYCKECQKAWRLENQRLLKESKRRYYLRNRESIDAKKKEYISKNRSSLNAYWAFAGAQRRAAIKKAMPKWADMGAIKQFYSHASLLNCWPGEKIHVDHIVPLKSDLVCGLHCENNLQLLGVSENSSKGNYYWPDMPGEIR